MEREEDKGRGIEKIGFLLSLVIEYLKLAVDRETREAAELEDFSMHEDQYPGSEVEVWLYRDDFQIEWR